MEINGQIKKIISKDDRLTFMVAGKWVTAWKNRLEGKPEIMEKLMSLREGDIVALDVQEKVSNSGSRFYDIVGFLPLKPKEPEKRKPSSGSGGRDDVTQRSICMSYAVEIVKSLIDHGFGWNVTENGTEVNFDLITAAVLSLTDDLNMSFMSNQSDKPDKK